MNNYRDPNGTQLPEYDSVADQNRYDRLKADRDSVISANRALEAELGRVRMILVATARGESTADAAERMVKELVALRGDDTRRGVLLHRVRDILGANGKLIIDRASDVMDEVRKGKEDLRVARRTIKRVCDALGVPTDIDDHSIVGRVRGLVAERKERVDGLKPHGAIQILHDVRSSLGVLPGEDIFTHLHKLGTLVAESGRALNKATEFRRESFRVYHEVRRVLDTPEDSDLIPWARRQMQELASWQCVYEGRGMLLAEISKAAGQTRGENIVTLVAMLREGYDCWKRIR